MKNPNTPNKNKEDYIMLILNKVYEVGSESEESKIYSANRRKRIPTICIYNDGDYNRCTYDMETTLGSKLSKEATKQVKMLIEEELRWHSKLELIDGEEVETIHGFGDNTTGTIQQIPIGCCRELAIKIYDIIMDDSNWG